MQARRVVLGLVALLTVALLAACSGAPVESGSDAAAGSDAASGDAASGAVELQLMGWASSEAENDRLQSVVDNINEAQDGFTLTMNLVPDYDTKLQTSMAGGAPPDVFYIDSFILAALQDMPPQVYEAAQMDGAGTWTIFRRITLPLLRPTTFFVVTLGLMGTYQVFDQVYVMSSGGPAKTTLTVAYLVYRSGFNNFEMGMGLAVAILLFIIIFILTMIQRRVTEGEKA